jgi:hypothetical protein
MLKRALPTSKRGREGKGQGKRQKRAAGQQGTFGRRRCSKERGSCKTTGCVNQETGTQNTHLSDTADEIMPGKRGVGGRESGDGIGACVEVESSLNVGEDARGGRYFVAATSLPAGDNILHGHLMNSVYKFVVGRLLSCFIPFILNFVYL